MLRPGRAGPEWKVGPVERNSETGTSKVRDRTYLIKGGTTVYTGVFDGISLARGEALAVFTRHLKKVRQTET